MNIPVLNQMEDTYIPNLYDLTLMKEDFGLMGEEDTLQTVFLSWFNGGFVAMTGLSRGGKDMVVDAADYCTMGDFVFKVPDSTSKTDLYMKEDQMNSARVHRYPDIATLQDKQHLEEIMKRHGEGKSATHSRALGTSGQTESFELKPPDAFVLFVASDNEQVDLNDYPELRNRALVVSIDASEELTKEVNERQARQEAGLVEYNFTEEERDEIRRYVSGIPVKMFASDDGPNGGTLNPVSVALNNQNPLPQHFTEARQDFPRLLDFCRSVALFHYKDRMTPALPDRTETATLLITPADVWYAMRIFGEQMILSALNLREIDFEMLSMLRDTNDGYSKAEIQMEMRDRGFNITNRDVHSALNNMLTKGYVRKDQSENPVMWKASEFAAQAKRDVTLNWEEMVEDTKETARQALPEDVAEEYIERFCEGDGLFVTHPFTGEKLNITKQNILEDKVEEATEAEEDVFSQDLYGGDSDDTDDAGDESDAQQAFAGGTLG
ncbi:hypothetical protein HRTV-22_gp71 [Halorubrum virus HRTV-22]|nr:hypothetical protein HRTV-18_gp70 [Halorubrum virus HRTV-18]UBF19902.1 hypothetical protein HRTV-20_gp70 [Halorubrum virus HRTV-20]UBF20026.1 hypothetical protein HRTV-22_gp71 [Halorubrum virus HRTV-22]UBF20153.1 hypothetical protein HRTV-26_gp72 [Halorubrum virus HRTV-26]UFK26291.1 hypothetical protein [Hardygib1 virus]